MQSGGRESPLTLPVSNGEGGIFIVSADKHLTCHECLVLPVICYNKQSNQGDLFSIRQR